MLGATEILVRVLPVRVLPDMSKYSRVGAREVQTEAGRLPVSCEEGSKMAATPSGVRQSTGRLLGKP